MRRAQGELRDVAEVRRRAQAFAFLSAPVDMAHHPTSEPSRCSLEYNRLGPEGAAVIAEGLKGNTTLQSLK